MNCLSILLYITTLLLLIYSLALSAFTTFIYISSLSNSFGNAPLSLLIALIITLLLIGFNSFLGLCILCSNVRSVLSRVYVILLGLTFLILLIETIMVSVEEKQSEFLFFYQQLQTQLLKGLRFLYFVGLALLGLAFSIFIGILIYCGRKRNLDYERQHQQQQQLQLGQQGQGYGPGRPRPPTMRYNPPVETGVKLGQEKEYVEYVVESVPAPVPLQSLEPLEMKEVESEYVVMPIPEGAYPEHSEQPYLEQPLHQPYLEQHFDPHYIDSEIDHHHHHNNNNQAYQPQHQHLYNRNEHQQQRNGGGPYMQPAPISKDEEEESYMG